MILFSILRTCENIHDTVISIILVSEKQTLLIKSSQVRRRDMYTKLNELNLHTGEQLGQTIWYRLITLELFIPD